MKEIACKVLEKRYDFPTEGWVLVDILKVDGHYDRGEIFGWASRERIDAELVSSGYQVSKPLMECGDQGLIHFVAHQVIPHEWQHDFLTNPKMQQRVFICELK